MKFEYGRPDSFPYSKFLSNLKPSIEKHMQIVKREIHIFIYAFYQSKFCDH